MVGNGKAGFRPGYLVMLGAVWFAFIKAFPVLSPIVLSLLLILLISLAVNPVIARVRAWTGGRKGAAGLVATAVVAIVVVTGWACLAPVTSAVATLSARWPGYWERLQKPLIKIERQAVMSERKLQAEVTAEITQTAPTAEGSAPPEPATETVPRRIATPAGKSAPPEPAAEPAARKDAKEPGSLRSGVTGMLQSAFGRFMAMAFDAAQILVVLVTVLLGVTFTLMNPRPVFGAIFALVPERHHAQALTIMQRIGAFVPGWAGATLAAMVAIGLLVTLLMWPIFGFVDAMVLGLIAGVLEAVPFVGPLLSAVPALLFAVGKGGMTPLWVALAYVGVQALENSVITPCVMASKMKLHPVAVIFSMLLCVAAFGVLGVLVAAPLVAMVGILHDEVYRKRILPTVSDADLDRLARKALHEKVSDGR